MDETGDQAQQTKRRDSHIVDRMHPGDREAVVRNIIGPRIRQRRIALGWSQTRLSEQLNQESAGRWNISHLDVRRFEAQRKIITDREILIIAAALGCKAAWLLGETDLPDTL